MLAADLDPKLFSTLPLDFRIRLAAVDYLGGRYSRTVRFPAPRPGLPVSLVEPRATNLGVDCCSFGAYVLITAMPRARWDAARYRELQIMDAAHPWSPIEAVERAGAGSRVDHPVAGCWHVTQKWDDPHPEEVDGDGLSGGHFRLSRATEADPDLLLVLESTSRRGGIGPTWSWARWSDLAASARGKGGDCRAAALGNG